MCGEIFWNSSVQEKHNVPYTCKLNFLVALLKENFFKDEINFNNIFYLSSYNYHFKCNKYKELLRYFHSFFVHAVFKI